MRRLNQTRGLLHTNAAIKGSSCASKFTENNRAGRKNKSGYRLFFALVFHRFKATKYFGKMSRIPQRTLYWNGHGKRATRDPPTANNASAHQEPAASKYSFGNGELFDQLHEIVSKFSDHQMQFAESTGFGFFAKEKLSERFDQQFSIWLMSKVDHGQRCINVSRTISIKMFPEDVSKVFGIPHGAKVPWHFSLDKSAANLEKIKKQIGIVGGKGSCSIAAEEFLRAPCGKSSKEYDASFKIAFIIYVMSILKDPKASTHWESENYLPALSNPDESKSFDWAKCILDQVLVMCMQAQSDIKKKLTPCPQAGCLLFLHIIYLDNMDYGPHSPKGDVLPRAKLFGQDRISRLIMEDYVGLKGAPPTRCFGSGKLRPIADVVYKRHPGSENVPAPTNPSNSTKRQRPQPISPPTIASTVMANTVNTEAIIALKAFKAKCIKHLTTARIAIEGEADVLLQNLEKISISCALSTAPNMATGTKTMSPPCQPCTPEEESHDQSKREKNRGQSYLDIEVPSFDLFVDMDTPKSPTVPKKVQSSASPVVVSPPRKTRRQCSARSPLSELKLASQSFLNARRAIEEINLNATVQEMEFSDSPVSKKGVQPGFFAAIPWKLTNGPPRRELEAARQFYAWALQSKKQSESITWISHDSPKYLEILSQQLITQLSPKGELQPDTCDAIFRTYAQSDSMMPKPSYWRHFLETDFAFRVLAGENYLKAHSIREQFVGGHIKYDISHCQMVDEYINT
ncbi:hypothetical protein ACP70R_037254 [Stipagrostis hirtigluma subsp. patula]